MEPWISDGHQDNECISKNSDGVSDYQESHECCPWLGQTWPSNENKFSHKWLILSYYLHLKWKKREDYLIINWLHPVLTVLNSRTTTGHSVHSHRWPPVQREGLCEVLVSRGSAMCCCFNHFMMFFGRLLCQVGPLKNQTYVNLYLLGTKLEMTTTD